MFPERERKREKETSKMNHRPVSPQKDAREYYERRRDDK